MGEIADGILDGVFCEGCGEYLEDETGYPRRCSSCQSFEKYDRNRKTLKTKQTCPHCNRKFVGLADHVRDKHTEKIK